MAYIEKEDIWFINGANAGQIEIGKMFIRFDTACIAKRIEAIHQTKWIAVNKGERRNAYLKKGK